MCVPAEINVLVVFPIALCISDAKMPFKEGRFVFNISLVSVMPFSISQAATSVEKANSIVTFSLEIGSEPDLEKK